MMIAIWDGRPAAGPGGTADIVEYARRKKRPLLLISALAPFGITMERGCGLDALPLSAIEEFNGGELSGLEASEYVENVYQEVFKPEESGCVPQIVKQRVRDLLIPWYVRASSIAKNNQRFYLRSGTFVYSASALAVAAAALLLIIPSHVIWFFCLEAILLLSIVLIVHFADRKDTHKNWIEARFLVERLRVSFFFASCGFEVSPIVIHAFLLPAYRPHDWMVRVFSEIWDRLPHMEFSESSKCSELGAYVRSALIQDQIKYHSDMAAKRSKMSHVLGTTGKVLFVAALVVAFGHILLSSSTPAVHESLLDGSLAYLAVTLPAIGAAVGGIRSHREYSRLAKRSQNMVEALKDIELRFESLGERHELETLLRETEDLMLRDTQDWLMLMKFVKLETAG
jgi:hypothetical protein